MMPEAKKRKRARNNRRHIPLEIVEEILLHLPIKSLFRCSCVSKSWRSIIFGPGFVKRRAALPGRERMVFSPDWCDHLDSVSSCPLSSISSDQQPPIEDIATPIICPIQGQGKPFLHASCDEFWCVQAGNSLFLWNPSISAYRKLSDPPLRRRSRVHKFHQHVYGLGYDSVGDDYKILKLPCEDYFDDRPRKPELYSLRSDSWRKIEPFPGDSIPSKEGVFVSGALHWMVLADQSRIIVSFDLSTEKYGKVVQPSYYPPLTYYSSVELTVLRGKLCVYQNYYGDQFLLWVMKDYGIGKSWTKMFEINCGAIPYFFHPPKRRRDSRNPLRRHCGGPRGEFITLIPLHYYDNGEILFRVSSSRTNSWIFMYKGKETTPPWKVIGSEIFDGFVCVESLLSPATWPMTGAPEVGNSK